MVTIVIITATKIIIADTLNSKNSKHLAQETCQVLFCVLCIHQPISSSQQSYAGGTVMLPMVQMRKLREKEVQ